MRPVQGHVLEIGTWQGKSACVLAGACVEKSDDSMLVSVDTFDMSGTERQLGYYQAVHRRSRGTFYEFNENAQRFGFSSRVIPIAAPSIRLKQLLAATPLRLAFIDGRHDYIGVKEDISLVMPLIVAGGIVACHDVDYRYPGIAEAIGDLLTPEHGYSFLSQQHCLVAYMKRATLVEGSLTC